jgi:MerR family mercuric resistance operon transcriptional regulator
MRTSELADRAGVNTETLRYYERRGLLEEPPRTPGGYRDYPVSAVGLLPFVKRARICSVCRSRCRSWWRRAICRWSHG